MILPRRAPMRFGNCLKKTMPQWSDPLKVVQIC